MNFLEVLSGKYSITFKAWLLLLPISVFLTSSFTPDGSIGSYPQWMALGALAHVVTGLVLLIGKFFILLFKNKYLKSILVLSFFIFAGVARGWSVSYFGEIFSIIASPDYEARMRSGATLVLVWFIFAAFIIDTNSRYRQTLNQITDELNENLALAENSQEYVREYRNKTINEVENLLKSSLSSSQKPIELERIIDRILGPVKQQFSLEQISGRLSSLKGQVGSGRNFSLKQTFQIMYYQSPYNPTIVFVVFFGSTASSRNWVSGIDVFILDILLNFIWIHLIFNLARAVSKKYEPKLNHLVIPVWLITAYSSGVISVYLSEAAFVPQDQIVLLFTTGMLISIILTSALDAYRILLKEKLAELQVLTEQVYMYRKIITQSIWIEKRRLTRLIHSQIQSRILATANRIGRQNSNKLIGREEISELREVCLMALNSVEDFINIEKFLEELSEIFAGTVELSSFITPSAKRILETNNSIAAATLEVIREGVNNAVKHSESSQIWISVSVKEGENFEWEILQVEIKNIGELGPENISSGLGLQTLDEISSKWTLVSENGITKLVVEIPTGKGLNLVTT